VNILVTGSEGNLGTFIVQDLKRLEHSVIRVFLDDKREEIIDHRAFGDLTRESFIEKIFDTCSIDIVIHCAARLYGVAGFNADVYGLFQNDLRMMLNILNVASHKSIKRFIYTSSSMVYEKSKESVFKEEDFKSLMPPDSSYGLTKFLGERSIRYFCQQYPQFEFTIWRPFNVVSPLEKYRPYAHVFVDLAQKILVQKEKEISFISDGTQKRCFTWVEDVSRAITDNLLSETTKNEIFNVGQTQPMEIREVAALIVDYGLKHHILDSAPKFYSSSEPVYDVKYRRPSMEKLNSVYDTSHFVPSRRAIEMYLEQALEIEKGVIRWR